MNSASYKNLLLILLINFAALCGFTCKAEKAPTADDPTQSIHYWKQYAIAESSDSRVSAAQQVFHRLLRTWQHNKRFLPPALYVVKSEAGPWAASLADGNILLSRAALDVTRDHSGKIDQEQLAFILAHELAHQQNDDMWHLKFFRLAGSQTPEIRALMMRGLSMDSQTINDLEKREAKADEDATVLMAMVGYNPFHIVGDNSFFTTWVENIWNSTCNATENTTEVKTACNQAKARNLRTQAKLQDIANKSLLFDLGIQAYVAGQYEKARHYLTKFEREFSSHTVHDNIGLTYLAEILVLKNQLTQQQLPLRLQFSYPIILENSPFAANLQQNFATRGFTPGGDKNSKNIETEITEKTEKAIALFERAIKIDPDYKQAYFHLAISYLLQNNTPMAKGILLGKVASKFGDDTTLQLLLALTAGLEHDLSKSILSLEDLSQQTTSDTLLQYAIYSNLAVLHQANNDSRQAKNVWRKLAKIARQHGEGSLFQIAVAQIKNHTLTNKNRVPATIEGLRINQKLTNYRATDSKDIWVDGELYRLLRNEKGQVFVIDKNNIIINLWQEQDQAAPGILKIAMNDLEDRAFKSLGVPDRQIETPQGVYLAYDQYQLAVTINHNKISGWFLY